MVSDEDNVWLVDSKKLRFKQNIPSNQAVNRRISNGDKILFSLIQHIQKAVMWEFGNLSFYFSPDVRITASIVSFFTKAL